MGSETGSRRALVLGLVAAALAALGIVLLTLGVIGRLTTATPDMRGFNAGQTVTVSDQGMSVYSRQDAVREEAVCRATAEGGTSYTFERPVDTFAVDVSGTPFYEVARSPEQIEPGRYELACEGTDQAVYAGPRADRTVAPGLVGTAGLVSGVVVLAAAALLGLGALLVGRGGRRSTSGQVAPMGGGPPPYPYGPPERHAPPGGGTDSGQDPYAAPGGSFDPYTTPQPGYYPQGSSPQGGYPEQPPAEPTRPLSELPPPTGRPYGSAAEDEHGREQPDRDTDMDNDADGTERQPRPWTW